MSSLSFPQPPLAARLARAKDDRCVVLRVPLQSGVRSTLMPHIVTAAADGLVLVTAPTLTMVNQWAQRLREAGVPEVRVITSDVAQELADSSSARPSTGVLLATDARAQHGPVRKVLESITFALCVFDSMLLVGNDSLPRIFQVASGSARTIVVANLWSRGNPRWPSDATVIEMSLDELAGTRQAEIKTYHVLLDAAEQSVLGDAARLLDNPDRMRSRAAMHSSLVRLAREAEGEQEATYAADDIWGVVDKLEALGPDARLAALTATVRSLRDAGPVLIVTSRLLADVEYVYRHLVESGIEHVVTSLPSLPAGMKTSARAVGGPPYPVEVITSNFDADDVSLDGGSLVYFTEPRLVEDVQRLVAVHRTGAVRAVYLPSVNGAKPSVLMRFGLSVADVDRE
ncbi:DEAD/DEAH box helicase family protein [Catellatospora sichuanensis]|uniref:DEAD/DEAH box helicase family protein n=1 Tax=Catellatospora sichuanensis TaxID=1969805 RepID=UPI001182EAB8|nr:DEAD/DEAH box helicase family protein [Catellatospora sichuanensis]